MTFELAHLTDLHLGPLPRPRLHELMGKRVLGFISWHRRRVRTHRPEVVAALLADLEASAPDHVAVTGDLVNIALPEEFVVAGNWLRELGTPEDVTLVPGNHDAYVNGPWQHGWGFWSPYMTGERVPGADEPVSGITFPYVRRLGKVALIGLSTAVPSPVGFAFGRLGKGQLGVLPGLLHRLGEEGLYRVILIHHPPLGGRIDRRRGLRDEMGFRAAIARGGAELVIAGHEHKLLFGSLPGPERPVPVVCGPSASIGSVNHGGYLRHFFDPDRPERLPTLELRRFDAQDGTMKTVMEGRVEAAGETLTLATRNWHAAAE